MMKCTILNHFLRPRYVIFIKADFHRDKKAKGMKATRKAPGNYLNVIKIHHFSGFPTVFSFF